MQTSRRNRLIAYPNCGRTGVYVPPNAVGTVAGLVTSLRVAERRAAGELWQDTGKATPATANAATVRLSRCPYSATELAAPSDAARPVLTDETGGQWSLAFDGTDDTLRLTHTVAETVGSLVARFTTGSSFASRRVLFSGSDPTAAGTWWEVGVDTDGRLYWEHSAAEVVQWTLKGSSFLDVSTLYTLYLTFGGTDFYAELGSPLLTGVEQNPLTVIDGTGPGCWLGGAAGLTLLTVGGTVTSGGLQRPWNGRIRNLLLYKGDIS